MTSVFAIAEPQNVAPKKMEAKRKQHWCSMYVNGKYPL
jgi:hypothetical protein